MKCSKCGKDIPPESKFCLSCGQPVSDANSESPSSHQSQAPRSRTALWAALAGLCIVAAVALVLALRGGSGVTQAEEMPSPQHAPVVQAPPVDATPQAPILDTDVQNPPLELKKEEKPKPPADVVAYLEHLEKVEKARQEITAAELNQLVADSSEIIMKAYPFDESFDENSAPKELNTRASEYSKQWQQLAAYFVSVRPPQACADLAGKYYQSLESFVGFMNSFQQATASLDVAKLKQIRSSQVEVDRKLQAADTALGDVCKQFGIEKKFSIESDTGQTPLMGF